MAKQFLTKQNIFALRQIARIPIVMPAISVNHYISIMTSVQNMLRNQSEIIEQGASKATQIAISLKKKETTIIQLFDDLRNTILDKLGEVLEDSKNNYYAQLKQVLKLNQMSKSKDQAQHLGNILSKIAKYNQDSLQIIECCPESIIDLEPLRVGLYQCLSIPIDQIVPSLVSIKHELPQFTFSKNMAYYSQKVRDKKVTAGAGSYQVTLINSNLKQFESSSISIKFNGGILEGENFNKIGLYFGGVQSFKFKYNDENSHQFILVGDNKKQYLGQDESNCDFNLDEGVNHLMIDYHQMRKIFSIWNKTNSSNISLNLPNTIDTTSNCYFCFILNIDAQVKII